MHSQGIRETANYGAQTIDLHFVVAASLKQRYLHCLSFYRIFSNGTSYALIISGLKQYCNILVFFVNPLKLLLFRFALMGLLKSLQPSIAFR